MKAVRSMTTELFPDAPSVTGDSIEPKMQGRIVAQLLTVRDGFCKLFGKDSAKAVMMQLTDLNAASTHYVAELLGDLKRLTVEEEIVVAALRKPRRRNSW